MRSKILLTLLFPGIIQVSEGNLKLGIPLLSLNWFLMYSIWPIIMPIALGLMLKKAKEDTEKEKYEPWKQELDHILAATNT